MHTAVYAGGQVEAGQRERKDQGDAGVEKGLQARTDTGVGCWTGGGDGQDVSGFLNPFYTCGRQRSRRTLAVF